MLPRCELDISRVSNGESNGKDCGHEMDTRIIQGIIAYTPTEIIHIEHQTNPAPIFRAYGLGFCFPRLSQFDSPIPLKPINPIYPYKPREQDHKSIEFSLKWPP